MPYKVPIFARLSDWFGPYRLPSGLVVRLVGAPQLENGEAVVNLVGPEGEEMTVTKKWFGANARPV